MRSAYLATLASFTLALSACGNSDEPSSEGAGAIEGEPIAATPAPQGTSWVDTASKTAEGGFVLGNPDAPLKLVEYASHTCSHCATFSQEAAVPLQEEYIASGRVSYEIRPLLMNPLDVTIDTLAQCGAPESFHALSDQAWGSLQQFGDTLAGEPCRLRSCNERSA